MESLTFEFQINDFDVDLLPVDAKLLKADAQLLAQSIVEYLTEKFSRLGGRATVMLKGKSVGVTWLPSGASDYQRLVEFATGLLGRGAYAEAEPILRSVLKVDPANAVAALNLGMALSDQQRLDEAIPLLESVSKGPSCSATVLNALGVAYQRAGRQSEAKEAMLASQAVEPDNPYTLRNLGAVYADEDPVRALPFFERAAELLPTDQASIYGYGLALMKSGNNEQADQVLQRAIEIAPYTLIAEHCRSARTEVAQKLMRDRGGELRMDVVMYIVAALKLFKQVGVQQTGAIVYEIAMLGRNGLDINDSVQKYSLRSHPGSFSGLNLLAWMYTGLKQLAPSQDAGVDFSREYEAALQMDGLA